MRNLALFALAVGLAAVVVGCGSSPKGSGSSAKAATPAKAEAPAKAPAVLRLASDPWPPFTDVESRPRVALTLVHTALDRARVPAKTRIENDFGEITRRIRAGELDGSAAIWRSAERESYLLYSKPYFENRLMLVGRKGKDVSDTDLSRLDGERIGIVSGYAYGPAVEGVEGPVFVSGASDQANLADLIRGNLDYVVADELLVYHLMQQHGETVRRLLVIGKKPIARRSLHFAVRRDLSDAAGIVARFDRSIKAMMADGSFNRILQIDWIRVDVDGDGKSELVFGGVRAGTEPPSQAYQLFGGATGVPSAEGGYHIDGKTYQNWSQVPGRYQTEKTEPEDVTLFEFKF